tara:strand:+ start:1046 stop:1531 length:486 start_codon:yes stop_codon:yes gene_type:complete
MPDKMKYLGNYTARGVVSEAETEAGNPQRVFLYDGTNTTAYRVIEFKIWGSNFSSSSTAPDVIGKLSKNSISTSSGALFMRADDDNQIAWAVSAAGIEGGGAPFAESIIDPENLIVEDLYVYAKSTGGTTNAINYLIVMEKYEIDGWRGTLEMARDQLDGE